MYLRRPASSGVKAAPLEVLSSTFKSIVSFSIVISVGIFETVTVNVVLDGAYLSVPKNETAMVAVPSPRATIIPVSASTYKTLVSLLMNLTSPSAPSGINS